MTIDYKQIILNNLRQLPPTQQQEVLNFTEYLRQKFATVAIEPRLSLKQLAKLPIDRRHQYLQSTIDTTASDFATDPEMTAFANLDVEY